MSCLFAMIVYNSTESISLQYAWMIEAYKLNAYAKGHKWIGTINVFNDINCKIVAYFRSDVEYNTQMIYRI